MNVIIMPWAYTLESKGTENRLERYILYAHGLNPMNDIALVWRRRDSYLDDTNSNWFWNVIDASITHTATTLDLAKYRCVKYLKVKFPNAIFLDERQATLL